MEVSVVEKLAEGFGVSVSAVSIWLGVIPLLMGLFCVYYYYQFKENYDYLYMGGMIVMAILGFGTTIFCFVWALMQWKIKIPSVGEMIILLKNPSTQTQMIIGGIIFFVIAILSNLWYRIDQNPFASIFCGLFIIFGVVFIALAHPLQAIDDKEKEELLSCEAYYLDGREVEPEKIDFDLYDYSIKENVCYLTGK